jgi:hypothetical protein
LRVTPLSSVGIIRYHRPEVGYTKLGNSFVRNARVSLRAFRVGAYVLSHADGFVQTQVQIARGTGLSVTTVREALRDLERDRYVVSRRLRERGHWVGTAYAVSDVPFTDEELANLSPPGAQSEDTESVCRESVPPKNTTPARETTTHQKTKPSGGSPAGERVDPEDSAEEEPMPAATALTLELELPEPSPPGTVELRGRQNGKSAATVVAAFVDSYRQHHSGGDPVKRDIGRVARDAAGILRTGKSTVEELAEAATAMGAGRYSNLGVQLNILRDNRAGRGDKGIARVAPREAFEAGAAAQQVRFIDDIKADPKLAAWVAEDPAAVEKLCQEDPSLRDVFAQVNAA